MSDQPELRRPSHLLDGIVGEPFQPAEAEALRPRDAQIHVTTSGDLLAGRWAFGLEYDVRLLVEAFVSGVDPLREEIAECPAAPMADEPQPVVASEMKVVFGTASRWILDRKPSCVSASNALFVVG